MDRILIVKLSSLGDIVHAFPVLNELKHHFPNCAIDWAVSSPFQKLVAAHSLVRKAIPISPNISSITSLRENSYDLLFDLQGNCKSGLVTVLAKAKEKVGFSFSTAREWPNILATNRRFQVSRNQNIRYFYLDLVRKYLNKKNINSIAPVVFKINESEKNEVDCLLKTPILQSKRKILVCPGSKWPNKKLSFEVLSEFLKKIGEPLPSSFLYAWGTPEEKIECEALQALFPDRSIVIEKMDFSKLQYLMSQVDLFIGVDSIALHLCGTTTTPTISFFGPTKKEVFQPIGSQHVAIQGTCPYGITFEKQCPYLRTCKTGACIRSVLNEELS
ncbi:MAG: glycosyltransferase family 9 protein [Chlamydiia bacterium]|nr:glycosyltransferase family 9 protein [Chlamydiia bacterium]